MEKIADMKMLSPNDLAEMWGVSIHTIHRLAHSENGLRAYKIGGLTRFKPSDVEAYLAANEIKAPEKPEKFVKGHFTYTPGMKVVSL